MATIVRLPLETDSNTLARWDVVAARIVAWAHSAQVPLLDSIVLLPFAQLLPEARRAFAKAGGWMPRIETTRTLASSLGPDPVDAPGQITFDKTFDSLAARALLRSQPWGAAWARRDARGFDQAAAAVVATAHELVRATQAMRPEERAAHWAMAREALGPAGGPGATERLLARVALEWASVAPAPATDRLFDIAPPAAWIVVKAGGVDRLADRLMADSTSDSLLLDTDEPDDAPFERIARHAPAAFAICDGFEHEAQCAAAQVLHHVQRGEVPVALIAQDRVLVRRVRALLERERLALLDESGWKLSTTRAAAQVMALLEAARADASTDDLLDWLKAGAAGADARHMADISALEAACRRSETSRVAALPKLALDAAAARLWAAASAVLARFSQAKRQPLAAWLGTLAAALAESGALATLQSDDAGRQLIGALRLAPSASAAAWAHVASDTVMVFDEFLSWVNGALEDATFRPEPPQGVAAQVVITPLRSAMLRPFAAIVFPGADDKQLGAPAASVSLLSDAQAATFGVPTAAEQRHDESLAFATGARDATARARDPRRSVEPRRVRDQPGQRRRAAVPLRRDDRAARAERARDARAARGRQPAALRLRPRCTIRLPAERARREGRRAGVRFGRWHAAHRADDRFVATRIRRRALGRRPAPDARRLLSLRQRAPFEHARRLPRRCGERRACADRAHADRGTAARLRDHP